MPSLPELTESLVAVGASTDAVGNRWCIPADLAFRLGCTNEQAAARLEQLAGHGLVESVPASEVRARRTSFWRLTDDGRAALAERARHRGYRPAGQEDSDAAA